LNFSLSTFAFQPSGEAAFARMAGPTVKKCSGGAFQGGAGERDGLFRHPRLKVEI
jgi:hypothetical protein